MFAAAYLPPLWFHIMDKRLIEVTGGDLSKINILPERRAELIRKYGLHEHQETVELDQAA